MGTLLSITNTILHIGSSYYQFGQLNDISPEGLTRAVTYMQSRGLQNESSNAGVVLQLINRLVLYDNPYIQASLAIEDFDILYTCVFLFQSSLLFCSYFIVYISLATIIF